MPRSHQSVLTPVSETCSHTRLQDNIHFEPDHGRVMLFDQRMLMMHGNSLGELRRELIERLGRDRTRGIMTRIGYQQGASDARCLREQLGGDLTETLGLGPRLREIEGFVLNHAVDRMQFNTDTGEFWGDYFWRASWEAEAHLAHFGVSGSPACWMMTGYACGFTTVLMGRPILWRETECVATGHEQCRVIGQPLEDCDDAEDHLRFLQVEDFVASPKRRSSARKDTVGRASHEPGPLPDLVGASSGFNRVAYLIKRVAATHSTVLLSGESGVGKERFSRALHTISPRVNGPLISVNCAAIPADLIEAELFGVEKGAYTGATESRPGRFERASGGTLFLDEISSLPLPAQGKLLRAIQEQEIERVGGTRVVPVDVRIVAAGNRDLKGEVAAGRFREDLFYRLNVFPIRIPPLRERREDIPLLLNLFLERYAAAMQKQITGITQQASTALWHYDWPGNVRELENMVERAVILADDGESVDVQHLFMGGEQLAAPSVPAAPARGEEADTVDLRRLLGQAGSLEQVEQWLLKHALEQAQGNISAAARYLKLRRGQFEYRWRKYQQEDDN